MSEYVSLGRGIIMLSTAFIVVMSVLFIGGNIVFFIGDQLTSQYVTYEACVNDCEDMGMDFHAHRERKDWSYQDEICICLQPNGEIYELW